jgi:hypothetical protein
VAALAEWLDNEQFCDQFGERARAPAAATRTSIRRRAHMSFKRRHFLAPIGAAAGVAQGSR